ncbi:hypothetical protein DesfrDRAFT_0176 [Solidesulfovibrio fructosivorans JJ]]|uniref:Uncharacterized protein n=1 Tax=Solidesulfovibrio fructosivorans JJ] TaxID=596151 RepID=E1JRC7_SOLFR|nr:hypothetical protein [Solidesulfovibrio fructosivorans]EFL53128.1 hypothetical protein DesfrDRAFT_0176 [Solidesulfovibrio fructosivorans JJ]]
MPQATMNTTSLPSPGFSLVGNPSAYMDILIWLLAGLRQFCATPVHQNQPGVDPAQIPERMALHGYRWIGSDPVLRHHHEGA